MTVVANLAQPAVPANSGASSNREPSIDSIVADLDAHGAVALPSLVSAGTLTEMQTAFASRLTGVRWNNVDGYVRSERMRLGVGDVLTLAQGFVDIGVHPIVAGVIRRYVGEKATLCETKGWETLRSLKDFHGWHGDSWYDKEVLQDTIPREVKLAFYLTDVNSGAFQYIKGSHRRQVPRLLTKHQAQELNTSDILEFKGVAGTAMLFDTSGIHRQGIPVLDPRQAVFYNYHDPEIPLQKEDVDSYRYHPLVLNAAFLGNLTPQQQSLLGFGVKSRLQVGYTQKAQHRWLHDLLTSANAVQVHIDELSDRVIGGIKRRLKIGG